MLVKVHEISPSVSIKWLDPSLDPCKWELRATALFMVPDNIRMQQRFWHLWISLTYLLFFSICQQMILSMVLVGTPNLMCQNPVAQIVLLHMTGNSFMSHFCWAIPLDGTPSTQFWEFILKTLFGFHIYFDWWFMLLLEVMRGLHNLFLETVGITYMHIGSFFVIQQQTRWLNKSPVLLVPWSPWLVQ
jgi:hypothetical protein